jgi:homoserine kinase
MAVYTDVAADELADFLKNYEIGELLSYKGIAEGVENSNFLLHTTSGSFILTLYEKRVAKGDLPFFLELMTHLASRGVNCPQPVQDKSGEALRTLAGRPAAIITFLEGIWPRKPNAAHCAGAGKVLAQMHRAPILRWRARTRCRFRDGGRCSNRRLHAPTKSSRDCALFYRTNSITSRAISGRSVCPSA